MAIPVTLIVDKDGNAINQQSFKLLQWSVIILDTTPIILIAQNPARVRLKWQVVGANHVCIKAAQPGDDYRTLVYGDGFIYESAGQNLQGAGQDWGEGAPINAFHLVAAGPTKLIIAEGT